MLLGFMPQGTDRTGTFSLGHAPADVRARGHPDLPGTRAGRRGRRVAGGELASIADLYGVVVADVQRSRTEP